MVAVASASSTDGTAKIPDITPFAADPILLARLYALKARPGVTTFVALVVFGVAASWVAAVQKQLYRAAGSKHLLPDLLDFFLRRNIRDPYAVNLLSDYPSLILGATIGVSVGLVYGVLRNASRLHSSMESMGCIRFTDDQSREKFIGAIRAVNERFEEAGRRARYAAAGAALSMIAINIAIGYSGLYGFGEASNRYSAWWAGLRPFHWGSVPWIVVGAIGIYVVYVQSILGLTYVRFLRECQGEYRFTPNILNPDGFFGWGLLRKIISNMELGIVTTFLSIASVTYYIDAKMFALAAGLVLLVFGSLALYVFGMVILNFRRLAKYDKLMEVQRIANQMSSLASTDTIKAHLQALTLFERRKLVVSVPNNPIRAGWLVASLATVLIPIIVVVVQIVSYVAPPK